MTWQDYRLARRRRMDLAEGTNSRFLPVVEMTNHLGEDLVPVCSRTTYPQPEPALSLGQAPDKL